MQEPTEGYVVVTDDPGHEGVVLFMVDRRKQKLSFWSDRLKDVFILHTEEVAKFHAGMMMYNNPRSMNWEQALTAEKKNKELLDV